MVKSRFDIDLGGAPRKPKKPKAQANPGPMSTAIRDTAQSLDKAEEDVRNRRAQNAEEARRWREAIEAGLVNLRLPISSIVEDDLARDRLNRDAELNSVEMQELKASIRELGQIEPITVFSREGAYILIAGWRRLNALKMLHEETGDPAFECVTAQVRTDAADRVDRYVSMVTENVVRKNLSMAEMAGIALSVVNDPETEVTDTKAAVSRLFSFMSSQQRSYINSFVQLMTRLGDTLVDPRGVSRDLGVQVARAMPLGDVDALSDDLSEARDEEEQLKLLARFVQNVDRPQDKRGSGRGSSVKTEFKVGGAKITARKGEVRIKSDVDFSGVPQDRLEEAYRAFDKVILREE